jgi:hypothetical protein
VEAVCRFSENAIPLYIKNLSICGFWYQRGVLEPIPLSLEGWLLFSLSLPLSLPPSVFLCWEIKPRASYMLGKHSTIDPHPPIMYCAFYSNMPGENPSPNNWSIYGPEPQGQAADTGDGATAPVYQKWEGEWRRAPPSGVLPLSSQGALDFWARQSQPTLQKTQGYVSMSSIPWRYTEHSGPVTLPLDPPLLEWAGLCLLEFKGWSPNPQDLRIWLFGEWDLKKSN